MTDQELIQALTEAGNSDKFIRRADYWAMCCREAAGRIAALQSENGSKDKEIERLNKMLADSFQGHLLGELQCKEDYIARVEAEWDAAEADLSIAKDCRTCGNKTPWCADNPDRCKGYKWRGAQEEG